MKIHIRTTVTALAACLLLGAAPTIQAASIGVNFIGRGANGNQANQGYSLSPTAVAGQVAQPNWNNVDTGQTTFDGSVSFLNSDAGDYTSVSLTYEANDSWASDGAIVTPDDILMKGTLKLATVNYNVDALTLTITNLPAGTFDVLVYFSNDGTGSKANVEVGGPTKYYLDLENVFSGSFIRATATTAGTSVTANYAQFDAVPSVGGNIIIKAYQTAAGNSSIGINAVQLVQVSGTPWVNTAACSITTNPAPATVATGSQATFTVSASATAPFKIQWQKNTVDIPGATGATYTTPPTVVGDNGANFRAIVYNNVNTNTSPNALLTLVPPVQTLGFMKVERWEGIGNTTGEIGLEELITAINAGPATASYFVPGASVPQANLDGFGSKMSGWFIPPVSGNYTFYLRSDESSALYFNPVNAGSGANALPPVTTSYDAIQPTANQPFGNIGSTAGYDLVAGRLYGLVAIYKEGTGGDFLQVAAALTDSPIPPADLKPISPLSVTTLASPLGQTAALTTQPVSQTVQETRPAKFTVGATTAPTTGLFGVQWRKNGTPIVGASAATYNIPSTPIGDSGALISASVYTLAGVLTTTNAVLTVVPDTFPPLAQAAAITQIFSNGNTAIQVGVTFDEAVDRSTLVAGNFTVSSGTATFTIATNSLDTYAGVLLNTTGLAAGGNYTVNVKNVKDLKGNTIVTTNVAFTVGQIGWADVGIPPRPSQVVPVGADGFDILNGGRTEWATYDEVALVYMKKTNDFDVKLQVIYAEPSSRWARIGLQARNALDAGAAPISPACANPPVGTNISAYAQTHVNPNETLGSSGVWDPNDPVQPTQTTPNNGHEQNCRLANGAQTTGWGTGVAGTPVYPNEWLRLRREGTNIFGYRGDDGVNWIAQGSVSLTDQTNVMYVGPSMSVETGNLGWGAGYDVYCAAFNPVYARLFVAEFRNFSDVAVQPSNPTIAQVGANVVVTWTTGVLQSSPTLTPAAFLDVPGAVSPSYSTPATGAPKYFRVRGGN